MKKEKAKSTAKRADFLAAMGFIAPGFIGFLVFTLGPVLISLFLSFCDWHYTQGLDAIKFVGLDNFTKLFSDDWFKASYLNNIIFTGVTIPVLIILGLILANFLNRHTVGGKKAMVMYFIPYICSVVAISVVWQVLLSSRGPINQTLQALGVENPPTWLADTRFALAAIMVIYIWQNVGYYAVVYMSGLKSISDDVYEAASIDGAGPVRQFLSITVPLVSPTTFFLVTMGIIGSFKIFDHISVLTEGGPGNATSVMAFYIYRKAFQEYDMGYSSALAWALFALIFIVTLVQNRSQKSFSTD